MYVTGPVPATGGLGVADARRGVFGGRSELALDPMLRVFLRDLAAPYGVALREDLLAEGAGHSFGEMAEPLIRSLVPEGEPVDLLILAFAMHDIRCARPTATYLSDVCPGAPTAFAICEQGSAGAFTALRIIAEYGRTGGVTRAVLVVAEQSALHYEPAPSVVPPPIPDRHAAVALLCADSGGPIAVRQHACVAPPVNGWPRCCPTAAPRSPARSSPRHRASRSPACGGSWRAGWRTGRRRVDGSWSPTTTRRSDI
jgi:4-hydroxymandelate oxidase